MLDFLRLTALRDRLTSRKSPVSVVRPKPALDLVAWKSNETRTSYMRDLFKQPLFAEAMMVMQNMVPRGYPKRGDVVNDTMAAIELGRMQGYMDALGVLYEMTAHAREPVQVDATYLLDQQEPS